MQSVKYKAIKKKKLNKLNWTFISRYSDAIYLLEKNIKKIKWDELSVNPNAVHILQKNMNKINYLLYFMFDNRLLFTSTIERFLEFVLKNTYDIEEVNNKCGNYKQNTSKDPGGYFILIFLLVVLNVILLVAYLLLRLYMRKEKNTQAFELTPEIN